MPDIINLLSDHIANQIAAGEVIQRPASAVKELLENAIDAGATEIQLVAKDAGKELLQVIDNGSGMSTTDARMSFERHATSKIRSIEDLFTIRTMGFRGEALASIAAVAQVEMKTRKHDADAGTHICIEGTEVKFQEACATPPGTNLMVKNLFFNVPARRHFLKSNTTEFRHIIDEFTRVALANPEIGFKLWHNGVEQFRLDRGNLKERIVGLLGGTSEKNLVPVQEDTEFLKIQGFIGKPESAARTRGQQFFFINNRYIKSSYLHHAVTTAYEGLIEKESFPFYVLFLEIDPARVDVNVHPTKQEVKFEDDRMMYAYLQAAIRHALSRYNIAPSLDFTLNPEITHLPSVTLPVSDQDRQDTEKGYLYHSFSQKGQAHFIDKKDGLKQWKDLYQVALKTPVPDNSESRQPITIASAASPLLHDNNVHLPVQQGILLVQNTFLVATVRSGLMLVHIRRAQERIWYERLRQHYDQGNTPSQQMLFPVACEFPPADFILLGAVIEDLKRIGFDIVPFGKNTYAIQGIPSGMPSGEEKNILDEVLDQLKHSSSETVSRSEKLLMQVARRLSRNRNLIQQPEEQRVLIDELFACSVPEYAPGGQKVFTMIRKEELDDLLD